MTIHGSPHDEEVVGPSNRSFGLVFTVVFTIVALLPMWRGAAPRWWAVAVAALFGALALLLFGLVAVSGMRLIAMAGLDQRAAVIVTNSRDRHKPCLAGAHAIQRPSW